MKKLFSTVILFSLLILSSMSQERITHLTPRTLLDDPKMEVLYDWSVYDPILKETKQFDFILQIGDKFSKYWGYQRYQSDSVAYPISDLSKLTTEEYFRITKPYNIYKCTPLIIFKNKTDMVISFVDRIPFDYYSYEEDFPIWDWTLSDDTLTVCEHLCYKATTQFRGREWIAWYSEDISEDNGPWKFSGLPGLMLKVEDSDKEHIFEAVALRKTEEKIWRTDKRNIFKTTRKQFLKQMAVYCGNPEKHIIGTGQLKIDDAEVDEKPRRRFYNEIERD